MFKCLSPTESLGTARPCNTHSHCMQNLIIYHTTVVQPNDMLVTVYPVPIPPLRGSSVTMGMVAETTMAMPPSTLLIAHSQTPIASTQSLWLHFGLQEYPPTAKCSLSDHPANVWGWSYEVTSRRFHSWCCRPNASNLDFLLHGFDILAKHYYGLAQQVPEALVTTSVLVLK